MIRVAILTISDSSAAGTREDVSGPVLVAKAEELGWSVREKHVLPDEREQIAGVLQELADSGEMDVVITTGGTGLSPRDVTPEATASVADRSVAGFGELMRIEGAKKTKFAALSRSGASTRGATLILNLPGSPKGALDSLLAVAYLVPHAVDLLHGKTQH